MTLWMTQLSSLTTGCFTFILTSHYYYYYYCTALKRSRFGPLLYIGLLVGYKGFNLISLGDNPLLVDGYASFPSPYAYAQPAWHARLVRC